MSKTCIVSLASVGREDYNKGLMRLIKSCKNNWIHDTIFWSFNGWQPPVDEYEGYTIRNCKGIQYPQPKAFVCSPHSEIPYQFKLGCIQIAREEGYDRVIWLDSSMEIIKDIDELFDKSPVIAFDNLGHPLHKYISDTAVTNLNCRNIMEIPQCWGGAIGFDFTNETAIKAFEQILHQSKIGSFNEGTSNRTEFIAHRHDQSVMSVIFYNLGIKLFPYGTIVTGQHAQEPYEYGKDYYIKCSAIS